jgi:hypothetical protein
MPQSQTDDPLRAAEASRLADRQRQAREQLKTPKDDETLTQPIAARLATELSRPARD